MSEKREITFLIKVMNGGGAERVITVLSRGFVEAGYKVSLILTHQSLQDAKLEALHEKVNVLSLEDQLSYVAVEPLGAKLKMIQGRLEGKFSRLLLKRESDKGLIDKYWSRNFTKVELLKSYVKKHKETTLIAFLYDTIFLTLLANQKNGNRLIISERGDPEQSTGSKTTMAFLHSKFKEADHVIFQSPDVRNWYKQHTNVDGKIIFNPIKENLPEPFLGRRRNRIVNFCRISKEKNLSLLIRSFYSLSQEYPEYELYIYGDTVDSITEQYLDELEMIAKGRENEEKVHFLPSMLNIHEEVKDYKMFVSSSDFEGMSNSMLEAMAMGMPVVCTDCPAGGARAVIQDHENGLLVPVKDEDSLCLAMKELIEKPELADRLSKNAVKIREEQSLEKIMKQWMELIDG